MLKFIGIVLKIYTFLKCLKIVKTIFTKVIHVNSDLSMNVFRAGDKSERGFSQYISSDLLHALRFLGGLYNFCNFVIIFSLM